ncbi:photosystem I P700 chlorophyll a apo A, partial (chloroplast), partial [Olea europaea subsp. europaea]
MRAIDETTDSKKGIDIEAHKQEESIMNKQPQPMVDQCYNLERRDRAVAFFFATPLPMARCAPKYEKSLQALLCQNLNIKSATLPNATSSRRIGQEILNGDVGGDFRGIQITSGFFQILRASGITSELQLYCTEISVFL